MGRRDVVLMGLLGGGGGVDLEEDGISGRGVSCEAQSDEA